MRLSRCLLIACVTLSQACDSKEAAPPAAPVVTKIAAIVVDDTGYTVDGVRGAPIDAASATLEIDGKRRSSDAFDVLLAAPKLARVELVASGKRASARFDKTEPDGPGMQVHLLRTGEAHLFSTSGREGTADNPLVMTKLDDPGLNTLRASLAEIRARTKITRIDAVIDRVQPMSVVVDLVAALAGAGFDVRLVAGVPSTTSLLGMSMEGPPGIDNMLRDNDKPLRRCFEQSLRRDGPINDLTVEVTLDVDKTGKVNWAKVGSTQTMSAAFVNCVSTALLAWKLATLAGPFQFKIKFKAR
jgi:hypothetical protein